MCTFCHPSPRLAMLYAYMVTIFIDEYSTASNISCQLTNKENNFARSKITNRCCPLVVGWVGGMA